MTGAEFSEVDFDLLADYVGGALDGTPDEAVVAALIVGHPGWRRAHADLVEATGAMTVALQAWGDEAEPMPADVLARLDAAFATAAVGDMSDGAVTAVSDMSDGVITAGGDGTGGESAARDDSGLVTVGADAGRAASGPARAVTTDDGVASGRHLVAVPNDDAQLTTARKRARRLKWAAPIGIAAGLVAFLGFGIQQFGAAESQDSATSAGGAADQSAPEADHALALPAGPGQVLTSGTDYHRQTLAQAAVRAMAAPDEGDHSGSATPQPLTALPETRESGAQGKAANPTAGVIADPNDPLGRLKAQETLLACLDAISGLNGAGPITAQSIDYARYDGAPALIVQFTAGNGGWVWAAGADCGTPGSGADKLGSAKVG
ncbi:hypothetical protein AB0368_18195 [Actinoplanes sp. NPDC051475]|uniref:hypothetical protein n=1 Tax=Actinoplanes sp. NPDC051475 TaxID=3157225 RepID=UPI00344CF469